MLEEAVAYLRAILHRALSEDIGHADITTEALASRLGRVSAEVVHRSGGVAAGVFCVRETLTGASRFLGLREAFRVEERVSEGERVEPGTVLAVVEGDAALVLQAERVMLNFLGRMCGVAGTTALFVDAVKGTKAVICDTRKTTPLLRPLEKYAVRAGGGENHRFGLFDQVLIKDNHLAMAGVSEEEALREARRYLKEHGIECPVEIEVESLDAFARALAAGADIIMLDNMRPEDVRKAVELRDKAGSGALLEVSGGVTLKSVRTFAETGVDRISVGALTHSVRAADVALDFAAGR